MTDTTAKTSRQIILPAIIGTIVGVAAAALLLSLIGGDDTPEPEHDAKLALPKVEAVDESASIEVPESALPQVLPQPVRVPTPSILDEPADELEPCPNAHRKHIRLFRDAQVRPAYQHRTMLGVRISGVKEDSLWSELKIDNGDLIVESSGQLIDSPQASIDLLNDLESADRLRLRITTTEGRDRWIDWNAPPPPNPATIPEHCH